MKAIRRAMCALRLERALARRLNSADQKRLFGISHNCSVRTMSERARLDP